VAIGAATWGREKAGDLLLQVTGLFEEGE